MRARILAEHAKLREMLANVHLMVEQSEQGSPQDSDNLFGLAQKVHELLEEHMATEERWLVRRFFKPIGARSGQTGS